jgi:hypothetical protein
MPAVWRDMSGKSVTSATRLHSNQRQAAADCINQALEKSDSAEICHAIAAAPICTIFLTLRGNLGLRGRAFIVHLQVIQKSPSSQLF